MKDMLKNTTPLDGKKVYGLYLPENPFPLPRMKHLLKNMFPLYKKMLLVAKKSKTVSTSRKNIFLLKLIPPNFNYGFQQQKKYSKQKHIASNRLKISFYQPE